MDRAMYVQIGVSLTRNGIPVKVHVHGNLDPAVRAQIDGIAADIRALAPMTRAEIDRATARGLQAWADSQGTQEARDQAAQMAAAQGVRDRPAVSVVHTSHTAA